MAVKKVSDAIKILRDDREKEDFETVKSFLKRLQKTIADQDKKLKEMADTLDKNCDLSEKLEDMSIAEAVKFLEDDSPEIEGEHVFNFSCEPVVAENYFRNWLPKITLTQEED